MTLQGLTSPVFASRLIGVMLVISLAFGLGALTWRAIGWSDGRERVWTSDVRPQLGATTGGVEAILSWAPFGGGVGGQVTVGSSLGMSLRGIVHASGAGSTALISTGGGPVQTFGVGQVVLGNAVIERIEVDRVVFRRGGRLESLGFDDLSGGVGAPVSAAPSLPVSPARAGTPPPGSSAGGPPAGLSSEAIAALESASPIASAAARTRAAPGPQAQVPAPAPAGETLSLLARGIEPSPRGYVVGADAAPELVRAGLRPGDVIRTLNGTALGNAASDRQTLQAAATRSRAQVQIVREGRVLDLTIPLR